MEENRVQTLDLSELLTIRTIRDAQNALLESFGKNESLELKISEEATLDIAGIQLIISAQNYAQGASKHLALAAPISERALNLMERAGLLAAMPAEHRRFWLHEGA